jgi:hypothetical protein
MNASWKSLDGRAIQRITLPDGESTTARDDLTLSLIYEYHGEYDDAWVVLCQGGKELVRYNVKFIESIAWKESL